MRLNRGSLLFAVLISSIVLAADELPTPESLQKLQDEQNWQELLKGTSRVLNIRGKSTEAFDRVLLWQQKGEAQLQLKQFVLSAQSFDSATKEKTITPELSDQCTAMAFIVKKSDPKGYKPPATKESPTREYIDIFKTENRKQAMQALFEASLEGVKTEFDRAKPSKSLPSLIKVVKSAEDLPVLERAATGSEDRSRQLLDSVGSIAAEAIGTWVDKNSKEVERISQDANEEVITRDATTGRANYRKRGLTGNDRQDLKTIMSGCEDTAAVYKKLVAAMKEPGADLKAVPTRVEDVYNRATRVLNASYDTTRTR